MPVNKHKYIKGLRRKKTLTVSQSRLPIIRQLNKPNLQEPRKKRRCACFIPIIVNGVTDVNTNPNFEPKYNDLINNLTNKLRETINVNKKKCSRSKHNKINW